METEPTATDATVNKRSLVPRSRVLRGILAVGALTLVASCAACSPVYVVKAGIAEAKILRARQPIHEVLNDTTVDSDTRGKLAYVVEARRFAAEELGIDVGDSYTMFTQLDRDTLAMVVTAAYKDRLVPKTWWFPIVGNVPYKGHFSLQSALDEEASLAAEGYDTWVRPTAAFSTLGWFNDPILSTALRADEVEVVNTVIHELSHQHLFVSGNVRFNESFANFVGRVGAARFFCTREGGGPDSIKCLRAQARWRDFQRFSDYLDDFSAARLQRFLRWCRGIRGGLRRTLWWAGIYNLIAIIAVAVGWWGPWVCAVAMPLSSLLTVWLARRAVPFPTAATTSTTPESVSRAQPLPALEG